jgi:predicted RNase H-like HicB family nuclease
MSSNLDQGTMKPEFTAVIEESDSWWIGWMEEVPGVNCQERSRADLLETLKITLREALEIAPLRDQ